MSSINLWKNKLSKTSKFLLIFILAISWIFSGWPQIWHDPSIPPKVEKAQAQGEPSLTFVVSTDNFTDLTPGTPVWATSTLSVDTDNSAGWYVTLSADNKNLTNNVLNDGGNNEVPDPTNQWTIPAGTATTTGGNAETITFGDDFLYFRIMTASGSPAFISTAWWGTDDTPFTNAKWAGIASSTDLSRIGDSSVSCSGADCALNTVQFYVDVAAIQITGTYTGGLTFTATMN